MSMPNNPKKSPPKRPLIEEAGDHCQGGSHLKNWTTWLEQRQTVAAHLSQKVHRHPQDLVMNTADETREIVEEKQAIQYSKITTEFDKYRGNPAFWRPPLGFKEKCSKKLMSGHFVVPTKEEMNVVPSMEQVGVPKKIFQEKHIWPRTRNRFTMWQHSAYRQQKLKEVGPKIDQFRPHKPIYDKLIVLGRGVERERSSTATEQDDLKDLCHQDEQPDAVATEFVPVCPPQPKQQFTIMGLTMTSLDGQQGRRKVRLQFEYDILSPTHMRKYLDLENPGRRTIRLRWKKLEKFKLFPTERWVNLGFFFDKNELVLLPGDKIAFPIFFKSEAPGIYSENWEIRTVPAVWPENLQFVLALHAHAYIGRLKERTVEKLNAIALKARDLEIKDVMNNLLRIFGYPDKPMAPCKYTMDDLFELVNSETYLFNEKIVDELGLLYTQLRTETSPDTWDLNVDTLIELAKLNDLSEFFKNKEANELAIMAESNKPSKDKVKEKPDKKSKASKESKSKKDKKLEVTDGEVKEQPRRFEPENYIFTTRNHLGDVLRKLDRSAQPNRAKDKYFLCFQILKAYFTKMDHLLGSLDDQYSISRNSPLNLKSNSNILPLEEQPDRLVDEYFDCLWRPKPISIEHVYTSVIFKPKPTVLLEIPSDAVETIFPAYFQKNPTPLKLKAIDVAKEETKKKGKGKKGGPDKSSKKSKKDSAVNKKEDKKGKAKTSELTKQKSIKCFDPFLEEFSFSFPSDNSQEHSPDVQSTPSGSKKYRFADDTVEQEYRSSMYVLVHSCLTKAVDAFVDVLNSYECKVSHDTLAEVRKCLSSTKNRNQSNTICWNF